MNMDGVEQPDCDTRGCARRSEADRRDKDPQICYNRRHRQESQIDRVKWKVGVDDFQGCSMIEI